MFCLRKYTTFIQGLRSFQFDLSKISTSSLRPFNTTSTIHDEQNQEKLSEYGINEEKSSKAMRAYLERSLAHSKFMAEEQHEFKTGKRHLANMMGRDPETFTQEDVNEAIQYLFPSGLFTKKSRPILKPPEEVHPSKKEAEFDKTGRPFHFLFYTTKPNYFAFLNQLVSTIKDLDAFEDKMIKNQLKPDPVLALSLEGFQWLSNEEFENKFLEKMRSIEYRQLISTLNHIANHPYSYRAKVLIEECRSAYTLQSALQSCPKPEIQLDGREFVTFKGSRRKTAQADITVRSPGTGLLTINGFGLTYFEDLFVREQILFPLQLTGLVNKVDIESTVRGGGPSGQSGAIRYGISMALRAFVSPDMVEKMRLAGLLTRDKRKKERKKPGQAGARRKFTWKKR